MKTNVNSIINAGLFNFDDTADEIMKYLKTCKKILKKNGFDPKTLKFDINIHYDDIFIDAYAEKIEGK
jgi:hypothetical protein